MNTFFFVMARTGEDNCKTIGYFLNNSLFLKSDAFLQILSSLEKNDPSLNPEFDLMVQAKTLYQVQSL